MSEDSLIKTGIKGLDSILLGGIRSSFPRWAVPGWKGRSPLLDSSLAGRRTARILFQTTHFPDLNRISCGGS
jgi:hypothetical protein